MIPVKIGILDDAGNDIPLQLEGEDSPDGTSRLLILDEAVQSWTFRNVSTKPLLSIGRGFSAPVIFNTEYTREQLASELGCMPATIPIFSTEPMRLKSSRSRWSISSSRT